MSQSRIDKMLGKKPAEQEVTTLSDEFPALRLQSSDSELKPFSEIDWAIKIPTNLTLEKELRCSATLKKILKEEKIAEDKHEKIINTQIEAFKTLYTKLNQLTRDTLDQFLMDDPESGTLHKKLLEEAGLPKEKISDCLEKLVKQDPVSRELVAFQSQVVSGFDDTILCEVRRLDEEDDELQFKSPAPR